jgi:hypothetical protein
LQKWLRQGRILIGKQSEVRDPVGSSWLLRPSSRRQRNNTTQDTDKISPSHQREHSTGMERLMSQLGHSRRLANKLRGVPTVND